MKGEEPKLTRLAPHWSLDDVAEHAVDWWLTTEDLPKPDNRVTVDGDGARPPGLQLDQRHGGRRPLRGAEEDPQPRRAWPSTTCCDKNFYMAMNIPIAGVAHQAGTCRFGTDPATSVLDANCKAHELDNLYVVDTSFFPSIGAVNPALTAMANAIRVGEHLTERIAVSHTWLAPAHRVVIVGGGFGGLPAARSWALAGRKPTWRSPWSTGVTTTCSSRCSTRSRPG